MSFFVSAKEIPRTRALRFSSATKIFAFRFFTAITRRFPSITPDEMKRIVEQRLSPQYVSVHATDLKTRAYLLGVDEKTRRHRR
jgi:hypothetical protein